MKKLIPVFLAITFLSSCIANRYSYRRSGEEVHLKIEHFKSRVPEKPVQSVLAQADDSKGRSLAALMVLPYMFKLGYNQVEKSIVNEDRKHSAQYSAVVSDDKFYMDNTSTAGVNIDKITLYRTIQVTKKKRDTAFVITFGVEKTSDGYFLRFVPERARINYAKAKMKMRDRYVDFDLNVLITSYWINSERAFNSTNIGPLNMVLYNMPLRKEIGAKQLEGYATPWFAVIPRSQIDNNTFGTGNFEVRINVKEMDEMGENRINYSDRFNMDANREEIKGLIDNSSNEMKQREIDRQNQKLLEQQMNQGGNGSEYKRAN